MSNAALAALATGKLASSVASVEEALEEEMYDAVVAGDVGTVRRVLSEVHIHLAHVDLDPDLLMMAVDHGHTSIVECLLKETDLSYEKVPLHPEELELPPEERPSRHVPLIIAAMRGHVDVARVLLDAKANPLSSEDSGLTAIHMASCHGHSACLKLLLDSGVSANPAATCYSPLCLAAREGHAATLSMLLEHGADANPAVLPKGKPETPIFNACHHGFPELVQMLLDKGNVPVDIRVDVGKNITPCPGLLHVASASGHASVVDVLVRAGADVDMEFGERSARPLLVAAERGFPKIVDCLLEGRADASWRYPASGKTALETALMVLVKNRKSGQPVPDGIADAVRLLRKSSGATPPAPAAAAAAASILPETVDRLDDFASLQLLQRMGFPAKAEMLRVTLKLEGTPEVPKEQGDAQDRAMRAIVKAAASKLADANAEHIAKAAAMRLADEDTTPGSETATVAQVSQRVEREFERMGQTRVELEEAVELLFSDLMAMGRRGLQAKQSTEAATARTAGAAGVSGAPDVSAAAAVAAAVEEEAETAAAAIKEAVEAVDIKVEHLKYEKLKAELARRKAELEERKRAAAETAPEVAAAKEGLLEAATTAEERERIAKAEQEEEDYRKWQQAEVLSLRRRAADVISKSKAAREVRAKKEAAAEEAATQLLQEEEREKEVAASRARKKGKKKGKKKDGAAATSSLQAQPAEAHAEGEVEAEVEAETKGEEAAAPVAESASQVDTAEPPPPPQQQQQQPEQPKPKQPPDAFVCPLTLEPMLDPVVTCDGQTYERKAIEEWFARSATSPLTGQPLPYLGLVPNVALRGLVRDWLDEGEREGASGAASG